MANAYIDLQTLKGTGGLNISTSAYDTRLRALVEGVSRGFDRYCNRIFYPYIGTLFFDGDGSTKLNVVDLISVGTLSEDTNADGTFETNWSSTDYLLYPLNSRPTNTSNPKPYTQLLVNPSTDGTQDIFLRGRNRYRIIGTWGYSRISHDSGLNGTLANSTSTNLVLTGSATGTLEVGHSVLMGTEILYITATTGTSATVERAVNDTISTTHTNVDVNILDFPMPVVEASFIQSARLWRRKDSAFANQVGFPETGQMVTWTGGLDPDVKTLLRSYRRLVI